MDNQELPKILIIRSNGVNPDPRVEKEANSLLSGGYNVEILAWDRSSNHPVNDSYLNFENGVSLIHRIGVKATWGGGIAKNFRAYFSFIFKAKKWAKQNYRRFRAFHLCDMPIAFPFLRFCKRKKLLVIYDIFDYYPDLRNYPSILRSLFVSMENKCINKSDATIICSEARKEQIKGSHPKRLVVIHNSPSQHNSLIHSTVHWPFGNSCNPALCYIGNLVSDRLIEPLCKAVSEHPEINLLIGGDGVLAPMVLDYSGKHTNIFFVGKIPYDDVLAFESHSNILVALYDPVIPNHKYTAPNKFYESLFLGKPLLMCKGSGFDSFFANHHFGVLVSPSKEGIVTGINQLISKRELWPEYSEEEKKIYDNQFAWSIMERKLLEMYQGIFSKDVR